MEWQDSFQERLDRLDAGLAVADCMAGLPADEAALVELAHDLRQLTFPPRSPEAVEGQRQALLNRASTAARPKRQGAWMAGAAAVALLACASMALLSLGGWWLFGSSIADREPAAPAEAIPGIGAPEIEPTWAFTADDPQQAVVAATRGLVEIQNSGGGWLRAEAGQALSAGQRIRTGSLSSAVLLFHDGSYVSLEASSELSIDQLDARRDGPRLIEMTQWTGRSRHEVAYSEDKESRYLVDSQHGSGEARGTSFTVIVTSYYARFNVDEGEVAVFAQAITVLVVGGQSTTIPAGQPPGEPVFRIRGEGEVTGTGAIWGISGQSFLTNLDTQITGSPQVGDWVYVEARILPDGTRFADLIVLLRRAPQNSFELIGPVGARGDSLWTIGGQAISVDEHTAIQPGIEAGDVVVVSGTLLEDGQLRAESIRLHAEEALYPFEFTGVVEAKGNPWLIGGQSIATNDHTEIQGEISVGDVVRVEGWVLSDGSWLADEIKGDDDDDRKFEYIGTVDSRDPWVIAGIAIATADWTEIKGEIELGDRVKVEGFVQEDGSWLADEIKLIPEDDEDSQAPTSSFTFSIVGEVEGLAPWTVSGLSFMVDADTAIDQGIEVGSQVQVRGLVQADGSLLATSVTLLEQEVLIGCLGYSSVVQSVSESSVRLYDGQIIELGEGLEVQGDLATGVVVTMLLCTHEDGSTSVTTLVVVAFLIEIPAPPYYVDQPGGDSDGAPGGDTPGTGGDGQTVLCHRPPGNPNNAHTIVVGAGAVSSHLGHGDTLGPCP